MQGNDTFISPAFLFYTIIGDFASVFCKFMKKSFIIRVKTSVFFTNCTKFCRIPRPRTCISEAFARSSPLPRRAESGFSTSEKIFCIIQKQSFHIGVNKSFSCIRTY